MEGRIDRRKEGRTADAALPMDRKDGKGREETDVSKEGQH